MTPRKPPTKRAAAKPPAEPTSNLTALPAITNTSLDQALDSGTLLGTLDLAVEQMTWLKTSDAAMVALCRRYAGVIDDAVGITVALDQLMPMLLDLAVETDSKTLLKRLGDLERLANVGKVVGWIGPQLANALRDIGGTPGERKGLEVDAPVKSRLEELRAQARKSTSTAK